MHRMLISLVGVAGLLAALAPPAAAQEQGSDWIWKTDGKRWTRTEGYVKPYVASTTETVVVAPGEQKEGDSWRMKYTGKTMVREYTREEPLSAVVQAHETSWRLRTVGKATTREYYCVENGVEHAYHGMPVTSDYTAD